MIMKKIYFGFIAIIMAVLTSCSGSDSKTISPTSTEFVSGELAKYLEVVDQPAEMTYVEKDGAISSQYIRLKVTLKMTRDGLQNVDAHDINFTSLLAVATINLIDKEGTVVNELGVKNEDMLKLKKLLTGKEGDTAEITFEGEFHTDKAKSWFDKSEQFTPDLTGDINVESSMSYSDMSDSTSDLEDNDEEEENEDSESFSSDSGSKDWDALLDSYEDYVDKYVALAKKAAKGDMDALSEYPSLLEKAQKLSDELSEAEGSMSSSQLSRYMKITTKMSEAAAGML